MKTAILIIAAFALPAFSAADATADPRDGAEVSQETSEQAALNTLASWIALDAPPGWEELAAPALAAVLPEWERDPAGNWIFRKGQGTPRRVVAANLDLAGYVVSQIREDGRLRVQTAGSGRSHPLRHQLHEGQKIRVLTRRGPVAGVMTVRSTHLRGPAGPDQPAVIEDLYLDVGARNTAEVEALGIELLDPLVRDWPFWTYADHATGPGAASRVGCAAVAGAAAGPVQEGETIFVLATMGSFGHAGLGAALARFGRVDALTLVGDGAFDGRPVAQGVLSKRIDAPRWVPPSTGLRFVEIVSPPVLHAGSHAESVSLRDAVALRRRVAEAAGIPADEAAWVALPPRPETSERRQDDLDRIAGMLAVLADLPAVSGHEDIVRDAVLEMLPGWARRQAQIDALGNIILEMGPDRDPIIFLAHMDETGWEIDSVAPDGTATLRARGSMMRSLWEGQPALLHFDPKSGRPPLRGIFVPRDQPEGKQPPALKAWFGMDEAALTAAGVRPGAQVTAHKKAGRMGRTLFTGRALDDRAGITALLLALEEIDPDTLPRRVIFAWTVQEEVGLVGAHALADHFGPTIRTAYAVDTFVSSDSPLESPRFAYTLLGKGPVFRGLDGASVSKPQEMERIAAAAREAGIALQRGASGGGTDGAPFMRYGALYAGLSWSGLHSHSPVEVLDLNDLRDLARLIEAVAKF
ncbi:MAG: M20/M25/M40 family metallo-hydrolase [Acidobacteriota bacterium]|nr:M20/M25/M40 family metallo-hydrolase [Acidobacteriota bacterium]